MTTLVVPVPSCMIMNEAFVKEDACDLLGLYLCVSVVWNVTFVCLNLKVTIKDALFFVTVSLV